LTTGLVLQPRARSIQTPLTLSLLNQGGSGWTFRALR
jgi:hypothetical protein